MLHHRAQLVGVPGTSNELRQRIALALRYCKHARKLRLDDHQPLVRNTGIDNLPTFLSLVPFASLVSNFTDQAFSSLHAWSSPHSPQRCAFAGFRAIANKYAVDVRVVTVVLDLIIGGAAHKIAGKLKNLNE